MMITSKVLRGQGWHRLSPDQGACNLGVTGDSDKSTLSGAMETEACLKWAEEKEEGKNLWNANYSQCFVEYCFKREKEKMVVLGIRR